jgi:hypothetical protein
VSIQVEAVRGLVHSHEARYSSETIDWEASIVIVDLKDGAYS